MRKNKKSFWRPAAAGFGVMYLAITGLATWLVKEQFADDYGQRFREGVVSIVKKASEKEFSVEEAGEGWDGEQRKDFYQGSCWPKAGIRSAAVLYGRAAQRFANTPPLRWMISSPRRKRCS